MQISKLSQPPTIHSVQKMLTIRTATSEDFEKIWPIFHEIVSAGETYTYPSNTSKEQGFQLWMTVPRQTFVAEEDGEILGSYFIKTNQSGGGDHVCNCGYMVSSKARGRGLASLMCAHSQSIAKELGYLAMQFNFVVSANEGAVRLWRQLGFDTVGRLPKAFRHPAHGLVDALVMFKWLDN
jgi:L-amino acid N-acyltransferase YncA